MKRLTAIVVLAASSAWAQPQECPKPVPRPLVTLQTAISQDESMAQAFELAAAGCTHEDLACDEARAKCGGSLTQTLQKQISFDEGAYLRDILIAYQGQQYRMATPIASASPVTDVSCNADGATLKTAGAKRRVQAERRKLLLAEYPRWTVWVQQQYQLCQDKAAADRVRADAAAADAAKLLAAAELSKKAEDAKLDQAKAAERAAKEKADADAKALKDKANAEAKAKEDAVAQQKAQALAAQKAREEAEANEAKRVDDARRAAAERAEAEKRAKETEAETAERKRREAEELKIVADREAAKVSAAQKQTQLAEKEKARQDDVAMKKEQARRSAELAHDKKIADLKKSLELTEAERDAQVAQVDKDFEESEKARRDAAKKEIDAAGKVDHSDERMTGALSGHGAAGYLGMGAGAPLVGGQVGIRQGFWFTAPADGMASGVELRATGLFLTAVDGSGQLIQVSPEFRYWFGRFGLGVAGEYQNIKSTQSGVVQNPFTFALGPTLSLAAIDNPDARVFFTVRYLPVVVAGSVNQTHQFERVTGEIEGGYAIFSFAVQGGVVKDTTTATSRLGWFAGACLGARLRW